MLRGTRGIDNLLHDGLPGRALLLLTPQMSVRSEKRGWGERKGRDFWPGMVCRGGRVSLLARSDSRGPGGLDFKQRGPKRSRGFILTPYKGRSHGVNTGAPHPWVKHSPSVWWGKGTEMVRCHGEAAPGGHGLGPEPTPNTASTATLLPLPAPSRGA